MIVKLAYLRAAVDRLNKLTGSPMAPYTRNADEKLTANIGNYCLDEAYGGVGLHRIDNVHGGVVSVLGITTKRLLLAELHAYIAGIEHGKGL